jgi:hypothetical protein
MIRLESIPEDMVIAVGESEYLPIGELIRDAVRYIKLLEDELCLQSLPPSP